MRLAATPVIEGNLSTCHGMGGGECLHGRYGWSGHVAQPLAPSAHRGRPLLQGGPSSSPAPHPSSQHVGSARRRAARTIQMDAQTPTRAHGRVPTGAKVATARALGMLDSCSPLPPTSSKSRAHASQRCVTADSGSLASSSQVPRGPSSQCRGQPSQARWALSSTGGTTHPPVGSPGETNTLRTAELAALPPAGLPAGPSRA